MFRDDQHAQRGVRETFEFRRRQSPGGVFGLRNDIPAGLRHGEEVGFSGNNVRDGSDLAVSFCGVVDGSRKLTNGRYRTLTSVVKSQSRSSALVTLS